MPTAAISSNQIPQQVQQYFQTRQSDLQQLGQALQSGDTAAAQQEFSNITSLGQNGPVPGGNSFFVSQRQTDFNAIGQALQNGDLASAQQAFVSLQNSFPKVQSNDPTQGVHSNDPTADSVSLSAAATAASAGLASPPAGSSTGSAAGSEIVLNLGNITPGEQISIGISNSGNGGEQVTIGVGQQNQTPEQITLNLNQNSNQELVLNLFNSAASGTASTGSTPGNGVSVNA
jgi:hypothetical protein